MMKKVFLLFVVLTLYYIPSECQQLSQDEWHPFVLAEKMDPDSPANIGKLVLDAPAGKHGFTKVKDGHFYFEDGTRAKFWGTNLCFSACFPDKKQALIMADRLAFFGFNAVRLHHMDFYHEPDGIFKDTAPIFDDPQQKDTGTLSERQLKKLDYLIYLLKERGIYIDMNLLVSRRFTEADGVVDAAKLGMAAKPVSMFDSKLIELQKQYAKDLLTHYNPYTKLRYCDDPTIALIEITNENSIFPHWKWNKLNGPLFGFKKDSIPDYYVKELDTLWNEWLEKKYGIVENVKKTWHGGRGHGAEGRGQRAEGEELNNWAIELHDTAKASFVKQDNDSVEINVTETTNTPWHLQYRTSGIEVSQTKKYLLTFTASSDKPVTIAAVLQKASSPWTVFDQSQDIAVIHTPQTYEIPFASKADCPNTKLAFITGFSPGTITLSDISFKEIDSLPSVITERSLSNFKFSRPLYKLLRFYPKQEQKDIREFYINLERSYFKEMMDFLHTKCNVKIPITGIGGYSTPEDLEAQDVCDFIDVHTYWDHPRFPGRSWDRNNFTFHNKSMLADPDLGMIGDIKKRDPRDIYPDKPYTVTEWNHCYPNEYAYESPVLMAAYGVKDDWDALFQFAYSHGFGEKSYPEQLHSFFNITYNPQQLILLSTGSLLFLKGNEVDLEITGNTFFLRSDNIIGSTGSFINNPVDLGSFSVFVKDRGAIFLYAPGIKTIDNSDHFVLTLIGNIKNTKSGLDKSGFFNWGTLPILTQDFIQTIAKDNKTTYTIRKINREGTPDKKINTKRGILNTNESVSPWIEIRSKQSKRLTVIKE